MTTKTILVSSYFELRETPHFIKNPDELCPSNIKYFLDLDVPVSLFVGKIRKATRELFDAWQKLYPKFEPVYLETDYKDTEIYRIYRRFINEKSREVGLPAQRNMEKDTVEYLCLMHSRIEFMKQATVLYGASVSHFIWADFTIQQLFRKGDATREQFQYLMKYLSGDGVYFPGCWPKISDENCGELATRIFWRFCGGLFMGSGQALAKLYDIYIASLPEFFEVCGGGILTWEVNYWAWLEKAKGWRPHWYYALHTDSILNVTADAYTQPIESKWRWDTVLPLTMEVGWYPGSAAYVEHSEREYLNMRYVNYWITPEGYYIIHNEGGERVIKTRNVCCILNNNLDIERATLVEDSVYSVGEEKMATNKREKIVSKGVEDIRLFVDGSGELRFIGTTIEYSTTEMNRMIVGKYSVEEDRVVLRDAVMVEPPRESYIEKNWIPFVGSDGRTSYMYQWNGMEMGVAEEGKLVLDSFANSRTTQYWMFSKFRGSTIFSREIGEGDGDRDRKEYLVGLVHYSEDHGPRHYYHALVWLEVDTYRPVWVSQVFCFEKLTIEFCIGMKVREEDYVFWISRFDRDPGVVVVDKSWFHKIRV